MEMDGSTIEGTAPDATTAAAAAVLAALPVEPPAAAGRSPAGRKACTALYQSTVAQCNAPVHCAHWCVGVPSAVEYADREEHAGKEGPRCGLCRRRLTGKPTLPYGDGRKCKPRCKALQQRPATGGTAAAATPAAAAPVAKPRKRRAESNPGEQAPLTWPSALTRRITPPKPAPVHKKQRTTRLDDKIARLLEETHARRMAALSTTSHTLH